MNIKKIPIDKICPAAYNPRKDLKPGDPDYEKLKKSIDEFDMVEPLVWNEKTGNLVGGHQRLKILKARGDTEVEVSVVNLDEVKEKALNLALNKIQGEWDFSLLKDLLTELDTGDFDMEITGFDFLEIEDLMTQFHVPEPGKTDEDAIPEAVKSISVRGDLWQLGGIHRLLCGDAIVKADVERLMGGEKADMVFTDPPYGIDWHTDYTNLAKGKARHSGNAFKNIEGDNHPFDATPLFGMANIQFLFGANYYSNQLPIGGWVIWDKSHESDNYLFSQAEGCWTNAINAVRIFKHKWQGHDRASERGEKTFHPTQKPVQLIVDILSDIFKKQFVILDPFGGSGSTLIACEKLGRRCYMMEIDKHYCDVIIKRWEDFTGKKATKLE